MRALPAVFGDPAGLNGDNTIGLFEPTIDVGPEASRHVQGAALGPDGRAYLVLSDNAQNPGTPRPSPGATPMKVAVQLDGPVMPVS